MARILRNEGAIESEELEDEAIKALSDSTRRDILRLLAKEKMYPLEVSRELDLEKQKTYYHFKKLSRAGLIQEAGEVNVSGGSATLYTASAPSYFFDTGNGEEKAFPVTSSKAREFLRPLVEDGEVRGKIVVGSPEPHGPDRVQARDGHLAGEIGAELGRYGDSEKSCVLLDTEVVRDSIFDETMLLVGGVLTNTITRRFNEAFPASFEGEKFPYREIKTPEASYSDDSIGVVARAEHPEETGEALFIVAGVRNSGTEAAVLAFKNLESLVDSYSGGSFYFIVQGLDVDGDGEIDDYEVIETG